MNISISSGGLQRIFGEKGALKKAKELGADGVDFNLWAAEYDINSKTSIYAKSDEEFYAYFKDIKDYADSIGIKIFTTHGNGTGYKNIKSDDEILVKNVLKDIKATKILGAEICVIHTAGNYHLPPETKKELMHQFNYELFDSILPLAKELGVKVATETFGSSSRYGCIDFFGDINNFKDGFMPLYKKYGDTFCICVDTGHTNLAVAFDNPSVSEVIRMLAPNVCALHLHDNNGLKDQHKIPGTGDIDWESVFKALKATNYKGAYNLEISINHFGDEFALEEAGFAIKVLKYMLKKYEVTNE